MSPTDRASAPAARAVFAAAAPTIYFVAHNRSHGRIFAPLAGRIAAHGVACQFVDLEDVFPREGARQQLAALGFASIDLAALDRRVRRGDVVVVANDWNPRALRRSIKAYQRAGAAVVAIVEGARFAIGHRYRAADLVLGWGPSSRDFFRDRATIVGAPAIEQMFRPVPTFADPPFALVNYSFLFFKPVWARAGWVRAVVTACERAGIRPLFSRHPRDRKPLPMGLQVETGPIDDWLPRASLLITRPSTVIYQAMAAGVPVVYFPTTRFQREVEFREPMGAFRKARNVDDLTALVREALATRTDYHSRCRRFFEHHVSIDPARPAVERTVVALLAIAAGSRPVVQPAP